MARSPRVLVDVYVARFVPSATPRPVSGLQRGVVPFRNSGTKTIAFFRGSGDKLLLVADRA
jgi:hypothetical protein